MISEQIFGKTTDGRDVYIYALTNKKGESVSIFKITAGRYSQ